MQIRSIFVIVAAMWVSWFDFGLQTTLGVMLLSIIDKFGLERSKAVTTQTTFVAVNQGLGVFSGLLVTRFGIPKVSLVGSTLIPLGFFVSFFATSLVIVDVCVGVLSAIGVSLMFVCSVALIKQQFKGKNLPLAIALSSLSISLAGLSYPFLMEYILDHYGLSGTYLILSGYLLNNLVISILFSYTIADPDKTPKYKNKQSKKKEETSFTDDADTKPTFKSAKKTAENSMELNTDITSNIQNKKKHISSDFGEGNANTETEIDETASGSFNNATYMTDNESYGKGHINDFSPEISRNEKKETLSGGGENRNALNDVSIQSNPFPNDNVEYNKQARVVKDSVEVGVFKETKRRRSSALSEAISNLSLNVRRQAWKQGRNAKKLSKSIWDNFSIAYITILVGTGFCIASQNGYLSLLRDIFKSKGYTKTQGLMAFLPLNLCGLVARLLPGLGLGMDVRSNIILAAVFSLLGSVGELLILFSTNYHMIMIGVGLTGIPMGGVISAASILVAKIVGDKNFPIAFGFLLTIVGLLGSLFGPVYGALRDHSDSYSTVLTIGACNQFICAVLFLCAFFDKKVTYKQTTLKMFVEQIEAMIESNFIIFSYYM